MNNAPHRRYEFGESMRAFIAQGLPHMEREVSIARIKRWEAGELPRDPIDREVFERCRWVRSDFMKWQSRLQKSRAADAVKKPETNK